MKKKTIFFVGLTLAVGIAIYKIQQLKKENEALKFQQKLTERIG